jgi:hypothetical protein
MATKSPLVLADDGLIQQLQDGDTVAMPKAVAALLAQNNVILKLLANILVNADPSRLLSEPDLEEFLKELS